MVAGSLRISAITKVFLQQMLYLRVILNTVQIQSFYFIFKCYVQN